MSEITVGATSVSRLTYFTLCVRTYFTLLCIDFLLDHPQ